MHTNLDFSQTEYSLMWGNENELNDKKIFKILMLVYALVLFGSAALVFTIYEGIVNFSIYFVYVAVGVILGLGAIILIYLFSKKNNF
jgi:hypothetical protein